MMDTCAASLQAAFEGRDVKAFGDKRRRQLFDKLLQHAVPVAFTQANQTLSVGVRDIANAVGGKSAKLKRPSSVSGAFDDHFEQLFTL